MACFRFLRDHFVLVLDLNCANILALLLCTAATLCTSSALSCGFIMLFVEKYLKEAHLIGNYEPTMLGTLVCSVVPKLGVCSPRARPLKLRSHIGKF